MIDLVKLLGRWLVGLFRSHAGREAEIVFLRHQLLVLRRSASPRLRHRRVGRPAIPAEIRNLVRAVSRDSPLWGAPRIHGDLLKLGIDIAQSTVAKYMPRRHRPPSPGWRAFLRSHTIHIAAVNLFVVPTIGSGFCKGWSSCVCSGDGSSGPMRPQIQPPSGSLDRSLKRFRGTRHRAI